MCSSSLPEQLAAEVHVSDEGHPKGRSSWKQWKFRELQASPGVALLLGSDFGGHWGGHLYKLHYFSSAEGTYVVLRNVFLLTCQVRLSP